MVMAPPNVPSGVAHEMPAPGLRGFLSGAYPSHPSGNNAAGPITVAWTDYHL